MSDIKDFEPLWGVWRTEKLIGEGSYGKVYRASREEYGKKYYSAIKHISIPASDAQIAEAISEGISGDDASLKEYFDEIAHNLINEISMMNEVKGNSHIVSYTDHLIVPKKTGIGYDIIIRMELLTGLNDVLRHRQFTNLDVIKLGIDLCSALEVCMEKGIIHRDIKPSNIFVNDFGDYKLGDFGVARQLEHTTAGMSKKGTYIYMAPEVYRGEPASFSADTFSLGIVMYRLLNGNRAPFLPVGSEKIKPIDNENALARRMAGEPLPAPAFADEKLSNVILKATQYKREDRYASPTEFREDLEALLNSIEKGQNIPVLATPTGNNNSDVISEPTDTNNTDAEEKKAYAKNDDATIADDEKKKISAHDNTVKRRKRNFLLIAFVALFAFMSAAGIFFYNNIIINRQIININVTELDLSNSELSDISKLSRCRRIKTLSLNNNNISDISPLLSCRTLQFINISENDISVDSYDDLHDALPNCDIVWTVDIDGNKVDSTSTTLDLSGKEIKDYSNLKYLDQLTNLNMTDCGLSDEDMLSIKNLLPNCTVVWNVILYGKAFSSTLSYLDLSGVDISSLDELNNKLVYFSNLKKIGLSDCDLDNNVIYEENLSLPLIDIVWNIDLFGKKYRSDAGSIDLRGIDDINFNTLETYLIYFSNLKSIKLPPVGNDKTFSTLVEKYPSVNIRQERYDMSHFVEDVTKYGESLGLTNGKGSYQLACLGLSTYECSSYSSLLGAAKYCLRPSHPDNHNATIFNVILREVELYDKYIDYSYEVNLYK